MTFVASADPNDFEQFVQAARQPDLSRGGLALDPYSLDAFHRIGHLVSAMTFVTILLTSIIFFSMYFWSRCNAFASVKRPRFVPKRNAAVAQLISFTFFIRLLLTIVTLLHAPEEDQQFYIIFWAIGTCLLAAFVVTYVLMCDVASASSTAILLLGVALGEVVTLGEPDSPTTTCALAYLVAIVYWIAGSGKLYIQAELKKALKEIETETAAAKPANKHDRRRPGKQ